MKDPDLLPLVAWIMWEMFFDEPEPTGAHRTDDDGPAARREDGSAQSVTGIEGHHSNGGGLPGATRKRSIA